MLTPTQTLAASDLFRRRPAVLPGTRAILNDADRKRWFSEVTDVMAGVKDSAAVNAFCDLAGVPD